MIWKQEFTPAGLREFSGRSITATLGIEFTEYGDDYLSAKMPVDHRTCQPFGILHGGASVVLAETLGSFGSTLCLPDLEAQMAVGVEVNANHLRPATKGFVHGTARPVKLGRRMHIWNIEIKDDAGELICVSRLTIAIVDRK